MEKTNRLFQAVVEYGNGNPEAFNIIYEESNKYLYTCIYKVVKGNDNAQDILYDIMQDTYVQISQSIHQLDNANKFLPWAGTIATRKCFEYLKKSKKYVLLGEEDDTLENLSDDDNIIPEEVMQNREKQRLIREIIDNQLTEMQRLCIVAYYYNEQKQSEIAQELGIPENTVKTNLSRAKAKIKDGVLDLEKNKDTKLYSVAPLLLLLFKEEVKAAVVPVDVSTSIKKNIVNTSAKVAEATVNASKPGLFAKIAAASVKTKVIAAITTIGITSAVGGISYTVSQEASQPKEVWEEVHENFLLETENISGYAMIDYNLDEMPDLIVEQTDGKIAKYLYENDELKWDGYWDNKLEVLENEVVYTGEVLDEKQQLRLIRISVSKQGGNPVYEIRIWERIEEGDSEIYTNAIELKQYVGTSGQIIYHYMENNSGYGVTREEHLEQYEKYMNSLYQLRFYKNDEINIEESIRVFKEEGNSDIYQGTAIIRIKESMDEMVEEQMIDMPIENVIETEPDDNGEDNVNQTEQTGNATTTIKNILLHPENFGGYYPESYSKDGLLFAVTDLNHDGVKEVFIGDDISSFKDVPQRIFNILYEKNGVVYDLDNDYVYNDDLIAGFSVYENGILKNGDKGFSVINLWNIYTGESWQSNGSDGLIENLCVGEEIQFEWNLVSEENIQAYIYGAGILPPSGTYEATNNVKLEFVNGSVLVTEGNSTTKCEFTVDETGKLTIVSENEILEGTYDPNMDVIHLYGMEYSK